MLNFVKKSLALILALLLFPVFIAFYYNYLKSFSIVPLQLLWTIISVTALALFWRSTIMTRQVVIIERTQLEDIFSRAVEQVINKNLSLRLGGLASLRALAEQHKADLKIVNRISNFVCGLLRYPPSLEGWDICSPSESDYLWKKYIVKLHYYQNEAGEKYLIGKRPDIIEIIKLISDMKAMQPKLTIAAKSVLLQGANLSFAKLQGMNLSAAQLQGANLNFAQLQEAIFKDTNISACDLSKAKGLYREQLKGCYYEEGQSPPILPKEFKGIFKGIKITCRPKK